MVVGTASHAPLCAACRLRSSILLHQLARSRRHAVQSSRLLSTTQAWRYPRSRPRRIPKAVQGAELEARDSGNVEGKVLEARQKYGDALPENHLNEEEYRVYERLYGKPLPSRASENREDVPTGEALQAELLRVRKDGTLQEVEYDEDSLDNARLRRRLKRREAGIIHGDDERLATDIVTASSAAEEVDLVDEPSGEADSIPEEDEDPQQRTHLLTLANRFATSPTTLSLPRDSFLDIASTLLSGIPNKHLTSTAHRLFGGRGLPYSASTPSIAKTMQQKPVGLDAWQSSMSEIEADVYTAAIMPGVFASVMGVLVETRKRLGTEWAEGLVRKAAAGELKILDAGGAGAGVLAVRELLRAEWECMHAEEGASSGSELAEADGKVGGAGVSPPIGHATVLAGAAVLRKRASQLLDNTTFVPRLPDYTHADAEARTKGKFDLIVAPHSLWPQREEYLRKGLTLNMWSLLNADGGVLVLLEKGVARGFETIATARELLLESRIASSTSGDMSVDGKDSTQAKGMIIAPCTNHNPTCPMYVHRGLVKGRKDICSFEQRYTRPEFLQRILGAKDKNYEDVKFSYLAVMRGRDLRDTESDAEVTEMLQGKEATNRAFVGYEASPDNLATPAAPSSFSLPRAIMNPLKRRGHVILDLCTPSGTLERWTVPRSFSRQAFRDARKSSWGDLWALGAKTRVIRTVTRSKTEKGADAQEVETGSKKKRKNGTTARLGEGVEMDDYGALVFRGGSDQAAVESEEGAKKPAGNGKRMRSQVGVPGRGGKMRSGLVKGIRDKRDKTPWKSVRTKDAGDVDIE